MDKRSLSDARHKTLGVVEAGFGIIPAFGIGVGVRMFSVNRNPDRRFAEMVATRPG